MKITLDQATLAKAVINHLRGVGVQSDILEVDFRYTRVPYTVFAEVELAEPMAPKPTKKPQVVESSPVIADEVPLPAPPLVDPDTVSAEDIAEDFPPPDRPTAPLFGGG